MYYFASIIVFVCIFSDDQLMGAEARTCADCAREISLRAMHSFVVGMGVKGERRCQTVAAHRYAHSKFEHHARVSTAAIAERMWSPRERRDYDSLSVRIPHLRFNESDPRVRCADSVV
jgi:hypothetical protein